ncbi:MAG TPA: N-acetylornithine carbamoyltransferase [Gemmatimonadales bacterium]|nr:N-acetylornithine carbamoyltransferase [Gemmatimonadales bacterium]
MKVPVKKRDLLALEDWSRQDIERLLSLAARIKRGEITGGLENKVLALVFMDPSARTRISFETAMFLHGGHSVVLERGREHWSLETEPGARMDGEADEHLVDAARTWGRYADVIGIRALPREPDWAAARESSIITSVARHCERPVINLESARRHPCQELADALTLRERLGRVEGKRFVLAWSWHPRALPPAVPVSAALAAARLGMEIVIARPEGYELDPDDTALIRRTAQQAGGEFVHISDDPDDALVGADAVYVGSWGSVKLYGKPKQESETRSGLRDWRLTSSRLRSSRGGKGIVMHALPVRRKAVIDEQILDGPSSAVVDQAENRLHVQRAVLLELVGSRSEK